MWDYIIISEMKVVCITNDVEATTITGEAYNEDMARRVTTEALPAVLALYKKYGVRATFFCQGSMIAQYPQIVEMIEREGHEVACHGWIHDSDKAFDMLSLEEQTDHLKRAKQTIDKYAKSHVTSFRAPALRVNEHTPLALREAGYRCDSSVAPQRLDAFMSLGSKKKLQWIGAPRAVYETDEKNLARCGYSGIVEVPVSAYGLPYISTLMRLSPCVTQLTRWLLRLESARKNNRTAVCFLFHPGEVLEHQLDNYHVVRRSRNPITYFITGVLRARMKRRNLGAPCLALLENELAYWKKHNYEFKTVREVGV